MVVRMNVFFLQPKLIMLLLLHSALGECIRPNLGRSMLPNGDIFASGRWCTFLRLALILYALSYCST